MADAVARRSYGKLVAFLAARTHEMAAAEDALSEAFAAALAIGQMKGCPRIRKAWLLTAARRRKSIDLTVGAAGREASEQLQVMAEGLAAAAPRRRDS